MAKAAIAGLEGLKLHHAGIATRSIDALLPMYRLMGFHEETPVYEDPIQRVRVQFVSAGSDMLVELIEPAEEGSPVSRHLQKHGPGLVHLCYLTADIEGACTYVREHGGIVTCEPVPAVAFAGRRIAFIYWNSLVMEFLESER